FGPHLGGQLVVRMVVEPATEIEPLRGLVPVPAVLIGQHHFHDVEPEIAEPLDQLRQHQEVVFAPRTAGFGDVVVGHFLTPVRLTDQHQAAGTETLAQQFDGTGHAAPDPGGAHARGEIDRLRRDEPGGVGVHEGDPVSDAEFNGTATGLFGEYAADV